MKQDIQKFRNFFAQACRAESVDKTGDSLQRMQERVHDDLNSSAYDGDKDELSDSALYDRILDLVRRYK